MKLETWNKVRLMCVKILSRKLSTFFFVIESSEKTCRTQQRFRFFDGKKMWEGEIFSFPSKPNILLGRPRFFQLSMTTGPAPSRKRKESIRNLVNYRFSTKSEKRKSFWILILSSVMFMNLMRSAFHRQNFKVDDKGKRTQSPFKWTSFVFVSLL